MYTSKERKLITILPTKTAIVLSYPHLYGQFAQVFRGNIVKKISIKVAMISCIVDIRMDSMYTSHAYSFIISAEGGPGKHERP